MHIYYQRMNNLQEYMIASYLETDTRTRRDHRQPYSIFYWCLYMRLSRYLFIEPCNHFGIRPCNLICKILYIGMC